MADDPHNTSDISDQVETSGTKEDAETTATRRELKQTSISEKAGQQLPSTSQDDKSASDDDNAPKDKPTTGARKVTPPVILGAPSDETLTEQISSPKKKRAHAELDENKDVAEAPLEGEGATMADTKNTTAVTLNRTNRSEPEKKRPRDRQASASAVKSGQEEEPLSASASPRSSMEELAKSPPATTATLRSPTTTTSNDKLQTSSSAFANSGFAKLGASSASPFASASGASPFASAGAGKPSVFGSSTTSSFGSVLGGSTAPAPAKLNFGSSSTASPFASTLNGQAGGGSAFKSSPFGSAFGGGSALGGGARLTNFSKPGEALKSGKPAKPFGAPESDAEDEDKEEDGEEENGEGAGADGEEESKGDEEKEESERKRLKLHKIVVDDGESSEVTLFSQRAKMYVMEKGVGWKERGAGMLKVNVPRATVEFEDDGSPDATSFDASVLDDKDYSGPKNVRLIMRQDHTLRVILNTIVLPAMQFKIEKKLKAATVLFTAFENGEAQLVQMKLSNANADLFSDLVEMLKKGLADI
ncbi:hypothetical protein B0T21DRAFT_289846 [Apiosordaria backusii]|uniref:RanBD1 domain-containing protein n=1 Tax=Apiosordaria backusii TaxID=314023 RepID=A0AA40EC03_9PEZI|nr:hypothetical protein B0T21DRAFT_289846 [Apiosordaria backusii]